MLILTCQKPIMAQMKELLTDYSGGTVADLHGLPFSSLRTPETFPNHFQSM